MADDVASEDGQSAPPPYRYHTAELALPAMAIIFGGIIVLMTVIDLLLVLQPHLVMFEVLSLVVACPGVGLVASSPVGPVVGVWSGV